MGCHRNSPVTVIPRTDSGDIKIDMCPLRDHAPIVNVVGHRFTASDLDGALKPHGRLIYPIVVTRRIGFGLLSTD